MLCENYMKIKLRCPQVKFNGPQGHTRSPRQCLCGCRPPRKQ